MESKENTQGYKENIQGEKGKERKKEKKGMRNKAGDCQERR